jgi:mono/diheme cytochrome c family protein
MARASACLAIACAVAVTAGCGDAQRGAPKAPELRPSTAQLARGATMFRKFCYQCHPNGEAGLGPALNNKPLPRFAIRTQIREGVGAMPAFDNDWLADVDVDAIAAYVQELRASR